MTGKDVIDILPKKKSSKLWIMDFASSVAGGILCSRSSVVVVEPNLSFRSLERPLWYDRSVDLTSKNIYRKQARECVTNLHAYHPPEVENINRQIIGNFDDENMDVDLTKIVGALLLLF